MAIAQGTQRPTFHKTKSAWADAMATQLRAEVKQLTERRGSSADTGPDDPVRRKRLEAAKFDRMASAFRKKGL
jgi:hypothetical protein